jgi:hypothetical protein
MMNDWPDWIDSAAKGGRVVPIQGLWADEQEHCTPVADRNWLENGQQHGLRLGEQ